MADCLEIQHIEKMIKEYEQKRDKYYTKEKMVEDYIDNNPFPPMDEIIKNHSYWIAFFEKNDTTPKNLTYVWNMAKEIYDKKMVLSKNTEQLKEIGENANNTGGFTCMQMVYYTASYPFLKCDENDYIRRKYHNIEESWHEIGWWMGH